MLTFAEEVNPDFEKGLVVWDVAIPRTEAGDEQNWESWIVRSAPAACRSRLLTPACSVAEIAAAGEPVRMARGGDRPAHTCPRNPGEQSDAAVRHPAAGAAPDDLVHLDGVSGGRLRIGPGAFSNIPRPFFDYNRTR